MSKELAAIAVAVAAAASAFTPSSNAADAAGAFGKGRTHFVVTAGNGYAFNQSYLVLGLGASYYLIDGLNAGLFFESWSGSDPRMTKITPSLQYVFHQVRPLKPYVGGFYRRTNIDGRPDLDSVGARAGVYFPAGRNSYVGVGAVYESFLDCSNTVYRSCDSTNAELSFTIAF